jgi:hypothetical protein
VEHVITNARLANNVVQVNALTLSPTPQIVESVAMYAIMSLAPSVFVVVMGIDEFYNFRIHNFITNNSKTQRIPSLPKGLFALGAFNAK